MKRRAFLAASACGLAGGLSGCVTGTPLSPDVSRSEMKTYDVAEGTTLGVENRNGSVTVAGYDGDAVEVDVEVEGRTTEAIEGTTVTAEEDADGLHLRTAFEESVDEGSVTVSLDVRCPDGVPVERVRTSNGSVEVTGVAGDATLESRNGSLSASNVDGTVSLSTTNGSITAADVGALAGARTTNGSVDVEVPRLVDDAAIRTDNGSVDAALSPDLDATVTATTTSASVTVEGVDFDPVETSRTRVSGTLGDGTHALEIATTKGDVTLGSLRG